MKIADKIKVALQDPKVQENRRKLKAMGYLAKLYPDDITLVLQPYSYSWKYNVPYGDTYIIEALNAIMWNRNPEYPEETETIRMEPLHHLVAMNPEKYK